MRAYIMCLGLMFMMSSYMDAQRDVLFSGEASPTSFSWRTVKDDLRRTYDFPVLIDPGQFIDAMSNGVMAGAEHIGDRIDLRNVDNALAIGHDASGIALRYAQLDRPEITAMILDGVMNQGSEAIENCLPSIVGGSGVAQQMIREARSIQDADGGCPESCNLTGLFSDFIDEINNGVSLYGDVRKEADIITNINQAQNLPTVPYIVLYGTIEEFSLARFMDSRVSLGNSSSIQQCYDVQIQEAINDANRQVQSAASFSVGIFGRVLGFVGNILGISIDSNNTAPGIGQIISATGDFITGINSDIQNRIRQIQERDRELRRIVRCQTAVEILESRWLLAQLDGDFFEIEVELPCESYSDCLLECQTDEAWGDGPPIPCEDFCAEFLDDDDCGQTEIRQVFVPAETDGLLSAREQQLAGPNLVDVIHLPDTDHFQETKSSQQVLMTALQDIFDGDYGPEFAVPRR